MSDNFGSWFAARIVTQIDFSSQYSATQIPRYTLPDMSTPHAFNLGDEYSNTLLARSKLLENVFSTDLFATTAALRVVWLRPVNELWSRCHYSRCMRRCFFFYLSNYFSLIYARRREDTMTYTM